MFYVGKQIITNILREVKYLLKPGAHTTNKGTISCVRVIKIILPGIVRQILDMISQ